MSASQYLNEALHSWDHNPLDRRGFHSIAARRRCSGEHGRPSRIIPPPCSRAGRQWRPTRCRLACAEVRTPIAAHATRSELTPCALHHAARRGQLTLSLEWDPDSWTGPLWANHMRVKWWGEPGDGRLLWCALAAPPHQSTCLERLCTSRARRPAHSDEGEDGSATLRYDIACGPQQLAKYLADMRMLVLNLEQAVGEGKAGERPCYPALDLPYPNPTPSPTPTPT